MPFQITYKTDLNVLPAHLWTNTIEISQHISNGVRDYSDLGLNSCASKKFIGIEAPGKEKR